MIELKEIRKVFNQGKPNEFTAIHGVSLSVEMNKVTVFKGPSGSGKTTLLSLIGCMSRPTSGRIHLQSREVTSLPERFLTEIRRKTFGFIFQQFNLIQGITVLENVMLPAYPLGESYSSLKKRALALLDLFDLPNKAASKVEWLSGGEAQRVTIARALINNPSIIIADEPTAHLDTKLSQEWMKIVGRLKGEKKSVLIASHDPIVYESEIVDRVVHFRDGRIEKTTGPPPNWFPEEDHRPGNLFPRSERRGPRLMVFHPEIIGLYVASLLISFMMIYSSCYGIQILRKWDIQSGSELQVVLERKTYLISTLLTYVFGFQLVSFFLYIFTADRLAPLFVGAMCAAGTLKVNSYGYPALLLKMLLFVLAGLWLILNHTDNRAYDYPLIKKKYLFLLVMTPFVLAETFSLFSYLLQLKPNIITSCCGSLFSAGEASFTSDIASLPSRPMMTAFYGSLAATVLSGLIFYRGGWGGYLFSALSGVTLLVSIASVISFVSPYIYQLPTHHCPFCILQAEYGYIGYPLYGTLFGAAVSGMGAGVLIPFRKRKSLAEIVPAMQKRLALVALILFLVFAGLATYPMVFTDFVLEGSDGLFSSWDSWIKKAVLAARCPFCY